MNIAKRLCFLIGACLLLTIVAVVNGQTKKPDASKVKRFEMRCGWFSNPTPGNAWLNDQDGEWVIGVQGGHQAEGDWPDFKPRQWVVTNGESYGYGCACMQVRVNHKTHDVLEIKSARARPLSVCRQDRTLKK